jgi:hypothetical protein
VLDLAGERFEGEHLVDLGVGENQNHAFAMPVIGLWVSTLRCEAGRP